MYLFRLLNFLCVISLALLANIEHIPSAESDTLVLLHVLFRHGNRTPDKQSLFPNDPNINVTYEPFGYSQLTTKGKKTEFQLGQYIRQTYGNIIPKQYTPDVAYAITTNFKRTKMSLELVLAGLFPPLESDIFYNGLNWQPISFLIEQEEHLIGIPLVYCPSFIRGYYRYMLSSEGKSIIDSYKDLYQTLSTYTGLEVTTPEEVLDIFETLESERDFELQLPDWTKDLYPETLDKAAALYFKFATATPELRRLTNGRLLKKILDDSLSQQAGILPEDRKIFLYSAHDFHVNAMLNTLGFDYKQVPPYGSALIFEVHNVDGVYGLKLYFEDYTQSEPQLLTIPGCSSFCELDKLIELMNDNFPTPYDVCTYSGELM